jgi:Ca2+-binding RTX toxin-like protein
MATYVFNGSQSQTIQNFDVDDDVVAFDGLDVSEIASVSDGPNGATITTTSGTTLVFAGLALSDLAGLVSLPAEFLVVGSDAANDLASGTTGSVVAALGGSDTVAGAASEDDLLFGNTGNDVLLGNGGSDRLYGGQGNDTIAATGLDGSLPAAAQDAAELLVVGGLGQDSILVGGFTAGADDPTGLGGFLRGSVTVIGGNESADPADSADFIDVRLDADASAAIFSNGGSDTIVLDVDAVATGETSGVFSVWGGQGADSISGDVGAGSVIYGGLGVDEITLTSDGSITVYGGNGSVDAVDGADDIAVEVLAGADPDSFLQITSNAGNDEVDLAVSEDIRGALTAYVHGGAGSDVLGAVSYLDLGTGSQVYGGVGSDFIYGDVRGENVTIVGGNGTADAADGSDEIYVDLESSPSVAGGLGTPELPAITASASVFGNGGDDYVFVGGAGNASVHGGAGDDYIEADALGNAVDGIAGELVLTGGIGSDTFDIANSGAGEDRTIVSITDFNFDQDFIVGSADEIVQVSGTVNQFADLRALADNNNGADGTVAVLVTVTSGEFAGTYLAYGGDDGEIVNITGYTGTFDADVFTSGGGGVV